MKIGDRLKQIMEVQNLTANALAEKSGVPQPTISRIINGSHTDPRTKTLEKIAAALNYSVSDLRDTTRPDFLLSSNLAVEVKKFPSARAGSGQVELITSEGINFNFDFLNDKSHKIPVLSAVGSMGGGENLSYEGDQIIDFFPLSKSWIEKNINTKPIYLRVITGSGDSMSPTFNDGDLLLVDVSKVKIDIDGVYALSAHERLFIKRVRQRMDGQFEVSSDNPTVKTVDILNGDHEIKVHGRVVWAWNGHAL